MERSNNRILTTHAGIECDDERSGGFERLSKLSAEKVAVLGLVSSRLEDPDKLKARIAEASRYHPLERLALAPQCGFAGGAESPQQRRITEQTRHEKLALVAREVWG